MALSPMYAAILQDLNKAVAMHQPEDVLQFCANFFNSKLEEQRIAGRISLAEQQQQQQQQYHHQPSPYHHHHSHQQAGPPPSHHSSASTGASSLPVKSALAASSSSPSSTNPNNSHPSLGKKKVSLPSLVGQGYSFGGPGSSSSPSSTTNNNRDFDYMSPTAGPSPYSEVPPNMRSHGRNGSFTASGPAAVGGGAGPAPHQSANIHFSRPFGGADDGRQDLYDDGMMRMNDGSAADHARRSSETRDRLTPMNGAGSSSTPISSSFNNAMGVGGAGGGGGVPPDSGIPSGYNLGRRTSVSAESIDPSSASNPLPKTVIPKTASQRARIESSIEKNLLFRNLDEEQHNDVLNAMKEVRVNRATEVIVQGAVGDFFYVVESGEFQVWVKPQPSSGMITSPPASSMAAMRARSLSPGAHGEEGGPSTMASLSAASATGASDNSTTATTTTVDEDGTVTRRDGSKLVATISAGGSFGELALMYNAPRAATVVCSSESATLWALDRITFRTILMEHTSKKRRMYEKFLAEVPILVSLETHERSKIADALEERIYEEGEDVVREGEPGKNFYLIESGRAEVLKRKGGDQQERVGTLSKGDYFGELALLNSAPRAATVRPLPGSGRLRVATLGEKAFTRLLGPVVEILTRRAERNYGGAVSMSNTGSNSSNATSPSSDGRRGSMASGALITPTNPLSSSSSAPGPGATRDGERDRGEPASGGPKQASVEEQGGRSAPPVKTMSSSTASTNNAGSGSATTNNTTTTSDSRRSSSTGRHAREESASSARSGRERSSDDVVMQD